MDVHKNYLQVAVLDEKGKILNNSRVDNDLIKVNEFPQPSGLGLDPLKVGFLQLAFGLSMMIFGPVFGLMVAKRRGLNLKLLVPGIVITAISFLLLLFFHSTSQAINASFGLSLLK